MRSVFIVLSLVLLAVIVATGCNSAENKVADFAQKAEKKPSPQVQTAYADGARRITIAELQELIKKGQAFIVDVRNQASYDQGHIPGSKLIPAGEILNHVDELPKNKTIVTYCS